MKLAAPMNSQPIPQASGVGTALRLSPITADKSSADQSPADVQDKLMAGDILAVQCRGDKLTLCNNDGSASLLEHSGRNLGVLSKFKGAMLPSNLDTAVSKDYVASRKWHAVHDFATSITSYMGTAAALEAVGIGAGPLTVGMAWMLRDAVDGVGRLAGSVHAKDADRDPKGMYFKGETINTAGVLLESTLSVIPGAFIPIAASSQIIKALGASYRGAADPIIDSHQAINHNLAEVKAKNNNQDMVVNAVGGLVAFGLDQVVRNTIGPLGIPLVTGAAAAVKVYASKKFVENLDINFLTEKTVFRNVADWLGIPAGRANGLKDARELDLGQPIEKLTAKPERFRELVALAGPKKYLLDIDKDDIKVYLHQEAQPEDCLRATFQAGLVTALLHGKTYQSKVSELGESKAQLWAIETAQRALPTNAEIENGQDLKDLRLKVGPTRALWKAAEYSPAPPLSKQEFLQNL